FFASAIEDTKRLVVPSVCLYEVFKSILRQAGKKEALEKTAAMRQGKVVELSGSLALQAASLSLKHHLAMADGIVLATAHTQHATVWTQDSDFENLSPVKFRRKQIRAGKP